MFVDVFCELMIKHFKVLAMDYVMLSGWDIGHYHARDLLPQTRSYFDITSMLDVYLVQNDPICSDRSVRLRVYICIMSHMYTMPLGSSGCQILPTKANVVSHFKHCWAPIAMVAKLNQLMISSIL